MSIWLSIVSQYISGCLYLCIYVYVYINVTYMLVDSQILLASQIIVSVTDRSLSYSYNNSFLSLFVDSPPL